MGAAKRPSRAAHRRRALAFIRGPSTGPAGPGTGLGACAILAPWLSSLSGSTGRAHPAPAPRPRPLSRRSAREASRSARRGAASTSSSPRRRGAPLPARMPEPAPAATPAPTPEPTPSLGPRAGRGTATMRGANCSAPRFRDWPRHSPGKGSSRRRLMRRSRNSPTGAPTGTRQRRETPCTPRCDPGSRHASACATKRRAPRAGAARSPKRAPFAELPHTQRGRVPRDRGTRPRTVRFGDSGS